jgi:three-Cys-motif partner protein
VDTTYHDREQTLAKHFLLKSYLQALAFKILRFSDLTYVDGFSGPWKTQTENFADSSFMIAIAALKDAQQKIFKETKKRPKVRCFFSENNSEAFAKLQLAVQPYHRPQDGFEIKTYGGGFDSAVADIRAFVGTSFALIFIDPTGWTGYSFEKIKSLFAPRLCEVIINFMYGHVSRFIESDDPPTIESLNPILGGAGWRSRLDPSLPRGAALVKLFRESLKAAGNFEFVVATKIDKPTENRPHFFMAYATKDYAGLKTFRDNEYKALRVHAANRAHAKGRKQEAKSRTADLFLSHEADVQKESVDDDVDFEVKRAGPQILAIARRGPTRFAHVAAIIMEIYMLRETNVKDLVIQLARDGSLDDTWGGGRHKPSADTIIRLRGSSA